jgi:hypothetical protein
VEFAVAYGNDWFVIPVDLPAGSVFRLRNLVVRDTFGEENVVPPASATADAGWAMFSLDGADDLFVLPDAAPSVLEGDPLEEVALFRDEAANLAWGVERRVQGPSGEPVDRRAESGAVTLRQQLPGDIGDAELVYRMMTPVPEHWHPFVPVAGGGLERRPMLRFRPDGTVEESHPLGTLLAGDPLRLADEEVPRWGTMVTRRFQYARTAGGRGILWLGRHRRSGRGEGASGLRFDLALPRMAAASEE